MSYAVYFKGLKAGTLSRDAEGYTFAYDPRYVADSRADKKSIAFTLPKRSEPYRSPHLFPFFSGLLPQGVNRQLACTAFHIDPKDDFALLPEVAGEDTIGAVTVRKERS